MVELSFTDVFFNFPTLISETHLRRQGIVLWIAYMSYRC